MTKTVKILLRESRFGHLKIRILDLFRASCFGFAQDRYLEIGIKYMIGWGLKELANRSNE
jgi:hypothetical protein